MSEGQVPILDLLPLMEIADQTGTDAAEEFAETYRRMLPQRVSRIIRALHPLDPKDAMDAALSLRISSAMTGALTMERICTELVVALKAAGLHGAREAGRKVQEHLPQLEAALDDLLPQLDTAA